MRLIPRLNSTVWLFGRHWNRRMFCVQERDAVRVTASRMQPQHSQSAYKCAWLCVATRFRSSPSNRSTCHCIPHSKWIARLSRETATTTTTTKNPRAVCKSHYSACTTTRIMGIYNIRIVCMEIARRVYGHWNLFFFLFIFVILISFYSTRTI